MDRTQRGASTAGPETFELLHKWSEGDGGAAVDAFFDAFNDRHDRVAVRDASVDNLGLKVKSRILREDPPAFWMAWPGQNLQPYHEAGVLADVTDVWEETDMEPNYVDGVRDIAVLDGQYVAIPTDVHRLNNLYYNVELVEEAGVDPARIDGPRELIEVLRQLDGDGYATPLSQSFKQPRTVLQHWEVLYVGLFGPDSFASMTDGNAADHRSEIREALDLLATMRELADRDASFSGFVESAQEFAAGDAVLFGQGDWLAEVFETQADFEYERDWKAVPFPGTDGTYHVVLDAVMATDAGDPGSTARQFLEYAGSARGQSVFNAPKGSIPPREDVDMTNFPPFLRDQHEDFQRSRAQPPTIAHGLAVSPDEHVGLETSIADLMADWDVERATADFVDILGD